MHAGALSQAVVARCLKLVKFTVSKYPLFLLEISRNKRWLLFPISDILLCSWLQPRAISFHNQRARSQTKVKAKRGRSSSLLSFYSPSSRAVRIPSLQRLVISLPENLKAWVILVPVYTPAVLTQLILAPSFRQTAPAIWASKSITDNTEEIFYNSLQATEPSKAHSRCAMTEKVVLSTRHNLRKTYMHASLANFPDNLLEVLKTRANYSSPPSFRKKLNCSNCSFHTKIGKKKNKMKRGRVYTQDEKFHPKQNIVSD